MKYLDMAAELAAQVDWRDVYPNPRVGCVIVRDGEVLSTGVHEKYGGAHAEVAALRALSPGLVLGEGDFKPGLEVYITLEPCDHFPGKKTGSCTDALLHLNPKKVFIGALDPRFGGKNVEKLRSAGIEVEVVYHEKSEALARVKPYVILKMAQTLDGKIGPSSLKLRRMGPVYISSLLSRRKVHQLRSEVDAILTTTETVLSDNPILDCRLVNKKCVPKLCVFGIREIERNMNIYQFSNRQVDFFSGEDLARDMRMISEMGIKTILTECGSKMATSLLQEDLVDEIQLFVASRIFGLGVETFTQEIDVSEFEIQHTEEIGGDILITFTKKQR